MASFTVAHPFMRKATSNVLMSLSEKSQGMPGSQFVCAQQPSRFHVKTVEMNAQVTGEDNFRQALDGPPGDGYCGHPLDSFTNINNQNLCEGGVSSNIGFSYTVEFSVRDQMTLDAHIPVDFGWGGIVVMDGDVLVEETQDIW